MPSFSSRLRQRRSLSADVACFGQRCYAILVFAVCLSSFPAAMLARRRGVPLIYDMQSSLPEQLEAHPWLGRTQVQKRLKAAESWLIERSDVIVCSAGLKEHVRSAVPSAEVHEWWFAPQPLDVDPEDVAALRSELQIPAQAKVVLYTGNFAAYQGVPLLLQAAVRAHRKTPEAVFVLVGGSRSEAPDCSAELAELERGGAIRIIGRQPRERMPRYIAVADVLVSPRQHGENVPLKIFDYLQAGKPIVATDIPTHRTLLDDDRALLANMSAHDLAACITMTLRDEAMAARLGAAARKWADENLGWESFKGRVSDLYHSAVQRAQPVGEMERRSA